MATSQNDFYNLYYKQGESEKNKLIQTKKDAAESDKKTINAYADDSVQAITDGYNADVSETNESYEDAFRKNDVQVKLNERYLERKAAEMGLTDSGMNRTQMTANQISYANQKGTLTAQRQKAIDTLAAAMRSNIREIETKRNDSLAQVESTLNNDIAQINADYASSVREQAANTYNAQNENTANWLSKYDSFLANLINEDFSPEYKLNLIENFSDTYGFESIKQANDALKRAGLDEYYYSEDGMLQQTEEALEQQKNNKTYTIRKTNDTANGFLGLKGLFGGIDSNDTYEIVDDETGKVVKTIENIDDFSSLTTEQKRKLSKLNINEEISTSDFNFSSDGLRRFIESISKE